MKVMKNKKYFLAPTYQQINRILNKGWRLEAVNSVPCVKGDLVSIVDSEKYSFSFKQCRKGEQYYCLQRFLYYSLWSEKQYQQAIKEIEEYKEKGAYIISTYSAMVIDSLKPNVYIPPVLSAVPDKKVDILYYIILPKKYVTEQEENSSYDDMLKCLGAINSQCAYDGIYFLLGAIIFALMAIWKESGFIYYCLLFGFLIYSLSFFSCIRDVFNFFRYRLYRKKYSWRYFSKMLNKQKNKPVGEEKKCKM